MTTKLFTVQCLEEGCKVEFEATRKQAEAGRTYCQAHSVLKDLAWKAHYQEAEEWTT